MRNLFMGRFSKYSQKELKKRNKILKIVEFVLWCIFLALLLKVGKNYDLVKGLSIDSYWIVLLLISGLTLFRFETWVIGFMAKKYCAGGRNFSQNDLRSNHVRQTKFFTFEEHRNGSKNPLW